MRQDDARRVAERTDDDVALRLADQRDIFGHFRETFEQLRAVTKDKTATDAEKKEAQSLAARLPKQSSDALGDVTRSRFTDRDVANATFSQARRACGVSGYGITLREVILTGGGKTPAGKTAEYAQKLFDLFNGLVNKGTPITPADLQSIYGN